MAARVLVLEDDLNFRLNLSEVLEDEDYTVFQAGDSEQALSCARHTPLDLVVSDVRMAGIDGLATLELLRGIHPNLRSIVMTGFADDSAPVRAVKAQASDYLYKPFSRQDFLTVVRRVLQQEQEDSRYQGLLGKVFKGYRNLRLLNVDKDRERVFQAYFVLIRSRRLSPHEAQIMWERLRPLEARREAFRAGKESAPPGGLAEDYQKLAETLQVLGQSVQMNVMGARPSSPQERMRFSVLYGRIQAGTVSMEQLKLAPYMDSLTPLAVRDEPELARLHDEIWGQGSLDSR